MLEPLSEPDGAVLWEPSADWLRGCQLTRYTDWLGRERPLDEAIDDSGAMARLPLRDRDFYDRAVEIAG